MVEHWDVLQEVPDGSKMGVVDFQGRMYKVTRLRVVDASIFPDGVSAAPNPTVITAAEKIADQIKNSNLV
jgi:choline dehydrogenase-like flavoprotein